MILTQVLKDLISSGKHPTNDDPGKPTHDVPQSSGKAASVDGYTFTVDWFYVSIPVWKSLLPQLPAIGKILEVGSYEGRSATWLIENGFSAEGKRETFCVDTWAGGVEHRNTDMSAIEERFHSNIAVAKSKARSDVAVHALKGASFDRLASLIAQGHGQTFNLVYIDGSHQCADVLGDLVLGFQLCKPGGLIVCDDYLWSMEPHGNEDLLNQPKLAIDSFVNCYRRKLHVLPTGLAQMFMTKTTA